MFRTKKLKSYMYLISTARWCSCVALQVLIELTNGGVDRSVECTGNINAMISAFECVHDVCARLSSILCDSITTIICFQAEMEL